MGLRPGPRWESFQRFPDLLAGLRGPTSKRRGGEGEGKMERKGRGGEGERTPLRKFLDSPLVNVCYCFQNKRVY